VWSIRYLNNKLIYFFIFILKLILYDNLQINKAYKIITKPNLFY
jgi:hypothetical protein